MLDPITDLTQSIARARRARGLPPHVIDPAQVKAQLDAYLLTRGQRVANGMDLGPVQDQDLRELGYLDAVARHPTLSPGLAATLEMVADRRHPQMAMDQHELDHQHRRVHDHERLRETEVELDQEHERIQLLGIDQTAPDDVPLFRSKILEPERADGLDQGQGGSAPRSVGKRPDKNPMKRILAESRDEDDEEWSPA
jgi:hypothetical protein